MSAAANRNQVRGGDKPLKPVPAHQYSTSIVSGHGHFNHVVLTEKRSGFLPVILLQTLVNGNDQIAIVVPWIHDVDRNLLANGEFSPVFRIKPVGILGRNNPILLNSPLA